MGDHRPYDARRAYRRFVVWNLAAFGLYMAVATGASVALVLAIGWAVNHVVIR